MMANIPWKVNPIRKPDWQRMLRVWRLLKLQHGSDGKVAAF